MPWTSRAASAREGWRRAFWASPPPRPASAPRRGRWDLDWADAPLDWLAEAPRRWPVPDLIARAARGTGGPPPPQPPSQAAGLDTDRPVLVVLPFLRATWFRAVAARPAPGWEWQGDLNARGLARADLASPLRSHAEALGPGYGAPPRPPRRPQRHRPPARPRQPEKPLILASGRWWDEGKGGAILDEAADLTNWPVRLLGPARAPTARPSPPATPPSTANSPTPKAIALMREAGDLRLAPRSTSPSASPWPRPRAWRSPSSCPTSPPSASSGPTPPSSSPRATPRPWPSPSTARLPTPPSAAAWARPPAPAPAASRPRPRPRR
jgi:hypothetical protein